MTGKSNEDDGRPWEQGLWLWLSMCEEEKRRKT
jgi:hypothetical protein